MSIWGDGFADDGWSSLVRVRAWSDVSLDECVRLFPRLVRQCEEQVVADLVVSALNDAISRVSGCGSVRWKRSSAAALQMNSALGVSLSAVLDQVRSGEARPPSPGLSAAFAFGTAVHPAYMWPTEALAAERGTFLAWLGVLNRGRAALMPIEVAEYLSDVVTWKDGQPFALRDSSVMPFVGIDVQLASLVAASRQTLSGDLALVKPRQPGWILASLTAAASLARSCNSRTRVESLAHAPERETC